MQQSKKGGAEEATVDVKFTDLPNALIACKVPEDLFGEGSVKVSAVCQLLAASLAKTQFDLHATLENTLSFL
ncbi:hypothetical protein F2P81_002231 [Scophthalmus maximus]|uniref:Uncharacterized protein n=1 Tax=Scophthalmus maximus TaxID=52904 RepID=A0A6A4TUM2_SCOMX|nr:hypothetical protein F2P81_002231 [Scophthalmus maximus]